MKQLKVFFKKQKTNLIAVSLISVLSLLLLIAGLGFYTRYREQKDPTVCDHLLAEYTLPMMNGNDLCEVIRRTNPETDFH